MQVKSPLRWPGGKSRAVDRIMERLKVGTHYIEPFVGGGSVFLAVRQTFPMANVWINDANQDLMAFWIAARDNNSKLCHALDYVWEKHQMDGRALYKLLKEQSPIPFSVSAAAKFFILNRCTFSGLGDSGGYSEVAFKTRFTPSSIARVRTLEPLMQGVQTTWMDFQTLFNSPEFSRLANPSMYLDPPYLGVEGSKLYGKNGDLHTGFAHNILAGWMGTFKQNPNWLITYDNNPEVREMFDWAVIEEWELQYGMGNGSGTVGKGKEIFITARGY